MKARAGFIGFVVALVGVGLLLLYLHRVEQDASGGRKVKILVALDTIPRGKPIVEEMLGARDIPIVYVDERVVRYSDKDKILNLVATNTIPVQQSLAWSDVTAPKDDQRALSTLVQPGNRAAPLRVQMTEALPLIHPGDFVDVLCVCGDSKDATVLLQRVLVLATGTNTSLMRSPKDEMSRATMITVSVSLQESQLLALAMEKGVLTVVVRNAQDQRVVDSPADVTSSALTDASHRPTLQSSRRRSPSGPTHLKEVPSR
ncbi:MAG TPA: Flp pilus assembly protein CpaB [Labilithrix sp.]|nr:Flp pilus assembly protein CpaB [Labilithrix sp.]